MLLMVRNKKITQWKVLYYDRSLVDLQMVKGIDTRRSLTKQLTN
jgi:hypothetical protein